MNHLNSKTTIADKHPHWVGVSLLSLSIVWAGSSLLQRTTSAQDATSGKPTQQNLAPKPTSATPSPRTNEDWSLFRGDKNSTGVARTALPENLEVLWEYKVKQGAFEGTPAIAETRSPEGDVVRSVFIGDLDGTLFAFDLDSGDVRWKYKVEIGFVTAPAVHNGHLYVGDIDGIFYCFDVSGKLVWKYETAAEINSSANFFGSDVLFGSQDTKLYSLDQKTGRVTWEHETADQVRCSVTIVDDRAFVAGCDGGLHIVDLKTGKEISSVDIESPTGVTPAVMGDRVFVGTEQAGFFAIDWKTANVKWRFDVGGSSIHSCPAVTANHVVVAGLDRVIYSLNPETGQENWATTLKSKIESSPVIVGKRVFIGSTDGRLYAIELANGKILWEKQLNGGIIGSPAVAFERLVVATDRGVVYCLGSKKKNPTTSSR